MVLEFPTADLQARSKVCEPLDFYLREVRFAYAEELAAQT
jgi:hypothetical protein